MANKLNQAVSKGKRMGPLTGSVTVVCNCTVKKIGEADRKTGFPDIRVDPASA